MILSERPNKEKLLPWIEKMGEIVENTLDYKITNYTTQWNKTRLLTGSTHKGAKVYALWRLEKCRQ